MKPLNLDNRPCSPVSSNCIVWQGPNISCINLCNGDTISDVVAALATELCTLLDQTNVNNYDLACLGAACGPKDFQALIQLLINKICELNGITPDTVKSTGGCPDCVVTVASCFRVGNQTTMQLLDYVQMIAEKVCALIDEITAINLQITDILIRVEALENAPVPTTEIPFFTLGCQVGSLTGVQFINVILEEFINNVWCDFYSVMGTTSTLQNAVDAKCIADTDLQLSTGTAFSTNPNWVDDPQYDTVADAINNLWIALCDIYNYVQGIAFIVEDTNTVNLNYAGGIFQANVQDTGWHDLLGFGYMSGFTAAKPQCRRIGNEIIFRGVIQIPMGTSADGAGGTVIAASSPDAYSGVGYGKVLDVDLSSSPDACLMYSSGLPVVPSTDPGVNKDEGISIWFRQGLRVIPTSVLPVTINLDNAYTNGNRQFVNRAINLEGDASAFGVVLATHIGGPVVSSTGQLYITSPYSVENYHGSGLQNSSILRSVVSNIISGENIPLYTNTAPSNSNAPAPPPAAYNADINISSFGWPFSMNCNNAYELGGFTVRLDGLRGYIDPCGTLIATPPPC